MQGSVLAAVLLVTPMAASAQGDRVPIELSSFKFTPKTITLHHGQHYVLHFSNTSGGGHDFVARSFFAAARLDTPQSVKDGKVALDGGESADIGLTAPQPGRYEAHCSHFMHATFGMTGTIVVD
jgi:uncharacterized cupredoxin-like copper-binding protein